MQSPLKITEGLAKLGYWVEPGFLDTESVIAVGGEMRELFDGGRFKSAGVGNRDKYRKDDTVRRDLIYWLDFNTCTPVQQRIASPLESLRLLCNRELFLGLNALEGHYALYEAGGFYRRHLDSFNNDSSRVLSVILYLNEKWVPGDGGELVLHAPLPVTVEPRGGTLVTFLSREIEHEVLEARTPRKSYAGWFTQRG